MFASKQLSPLALLLVVAAVGCVGEPEIEPPDPVSRDLDQIAASDTLVVLTTYNSTSYFVYRGEPMGYEYDLLKEFAEQRDLALKPVLVHNRDSIFYRLNQGDGDVAAARLVPSANDTAHVAFTEALYETRPSVVQRTAPLDSADVPAAVDSMLDQDAPRDLAAVPDEKAEDALNEVRVFYDGGDRAVIVSAFGPSNERSSRLSFVKKYDQ